MTNISKKLLVEDFYRTTTVDSISSSGDVDFEVGTPPTNLKGFIIINPESSSIRERMFYHNVSGNRIYVKGVNRYSPKSHLVGATVQINDSSLIFNYLSENSSTTFNIEKTGNLTITVWGGPVLVDNETVSVSDTNITLSNNTTNYIYYLTSDNSINNSTSLITAQTGIITAEILTASGVISDISYRNYKMSIVTEVLGVTGAAGPTGADSTVTGPTGPTGSGATGATGPAGSIGETGGTQEVNDIILAPSGSTTIYSDSGKWIKTTYSNGTYVVYAATSNTIPVTNGIYNRESDNSKTSTIIIAGTYDTGTHSINFSDGKIVSGIDGSVTISDGNLAYINTNNQFKGDNTFNGHTIFSGQVSFQYHRIDMTGLTDILFDANNGENQKCINLTTTGAKTLSFDNLFAGCTYGLIINNTSSGNITLTEGIISNSDITTYYSLGIQISTISLVPGVHFFFMVTADTGIHISYTGLDGAF